MAGQRRVGDWIANRFEIYDVRAGGMGVVYVVYDHQGAPGQRVLALKTLRDQFLLDPKQNARFITECRTWVKLERHPHIVRAYSVQEIESKPHAVLELVTGGDLRRWIGTPRLDLPQVLRFGVQFCLGMEHAVQRGLHCHRDIKPENLLVTEGGTLKITDFGLAKVRDEAISADPCNEPIPLAETGTPEPPDLQATAAELQPAGPLPRPDDPLGVSIQTRSEPEPASPRESANPGLLPTTDLPAADFAASVAPDRGLTRVGAMLGTGPYMAPEQFRDAKTVDLRADIYSFGIVLFEMLTGERPFKGETYQKLARQHARGVPPSIVRSIPSRFARHAKAMNRIVQRCLAKDPAKRFASFYELRRALAKLLWRVARETISVPAETELEAWELTSKGVSLGTLGRYDEERASYEESIKVKPDYVPAWFNQAAALGALGRIQEAIDYADMALHLNPRSIPALMNKGLALYALRRYDEAIGWFDAAMHIQPRDAEVWYGRGIVLVGRGNVEGAKVALEQALRLRPAFAEALYAIGVALAQSGPWSNAQPYFQAAAEAGHTTAGQAAMQFLSRGQAPRIPAVPWVRRTEDTPADGHLK